MNNRQSYLPYLALAAVCIIWGTTYLALRIAVLHFPPFLFTAIRQTTAGLLLLTFMFTVGKAVFPSRDHLWRQAIAGFFMISMGNGLVAWAEMHIPSGVAAIICSLMPVLVILINVMIHRDERPTLPIIFGVILGLAGIVMIFSEHIAGFSKTEYIVGIVFTFLAVVAWAGGSIWIKKHHTESDPFVNAGLQMFFGGFLLFPFSFAFDDLRTITWSGEVIWSFLYLIVFGSLIAYAAYAYALRKLPMTVVSLYAYINPLVAVVLGWFVLNEALNAKIWIAMILTITGIYIVNKGYQVKEVWKTQFTAGR
ncbi:MAG: EamA family transporter [Cyclobacteriaceae bacterium]